MAADTGGWHLDISFEQCDRLLAADAKPASTEYTAADFAECSGFLSKGSSSFYAASKLLPEPVRRGTVMLYSFCRLADDLVDELGDPKRALDILQRRLDRVYAGSPCDNAVDRGLMEAVNTWGMPKEVFQALLEGFEWDSQDRAYNTIGETFEYCVRVASTVGVMMTCVMGVKDAATLSRACDLGVAFQITNICRDVGEDARAGKCYLPTEWLAAEGLSREDILRVEPALEATEGLKRVIDRMLRTADQIYGSAEIGVRMLPAECQAAVQAAHLIYMAVGGVLRDELDLDSVSSRARTKGRHKLWLVLVSLSQTKLIWPVQHRLQPARWAAERAVYEAFPEYNVLLAPFYAGRKAPAVKSIRTGPDGWPSIGGRRTENLAAPLYQTERISKLQYLKSARANGNAGGLLAATVIMVGWALVLLSGLQLRIGGEGGVSAVRAATQILLSTLLYSGLFITAHDAMHGLVCPGHRRLNDAIGAICVRCFAMFSYRKLLAAHWQHHLHPGTERDPDYHAVDKPSLLHWYFHFMLEYMAPGQLVLMGAVYQLTVFGFGVPHTTMLAFWVAPSFLSSFQLFYFGTYLPHRSADDHSSAKPHVDKHRSRSNELPTWLSLLTCYHFGYHWEHHEYPFVPWWRLPGVRHSIVARDSEKQPEKKSS